MTWIQEDILSVYEKPLSEREPVVCVDEKPVVLHQEVRPPQGMQPADRAFPPSKTAVLGLRLYRSSRQVEPFALWPLPLTSVDRRRRGLPAK